MADGGHDETGDEEPPPKPKTYNPDEHSIWPIYPAGTRLPIPKLSRGRKIALYIVGWVLLPAGIAAAVLAVLYIRHLEGR
jgi:hypothetical protein